ncbi:alpha/beta fold hydrolase [Hahella ganghwensis]|uniref:alpha/beta fold hydrolase n=1 Tax=Hahella ganghwensis TaxID=286420 RepID=UPI00036FDBD9|nr:alpha/beta hydrolase [Hahella ganghwensis]
MTTRQSAQSNPESSPTLVLLRGWMRDQRHWEQFPETLTRLCHKTGLDYPLMLPDIPGNGRRFREHTPASIPGIYRQLQKELGSETPIIIIGLSMGGMIGTEWLNHNPEQVLGLVLINSSLRPFAKPWERLAPKVWPQVMMQVGRSQADREQLILNLTLSPANQTATRLANWIQWSAQFPVSHTNACRQLLAAARYKVPTKDAPECPALIIGGAHDRLVNPICSKRIAEAWGCQYHYLPGGHDLPIEHPEMLSQHIVDWLKDRIAEKNSP